MKKKKKKREKTIIMKIFPTLDKGFIQIIEASNINTFDTISNFIEDNFGKKYLKEYINENNITGTIKEKKIKTSLLKQNYEPFKLASIKMAIKIPSFVFDDLSKIINDKNKIILNRSYKEDDEPDFYLPLLYDDKTNLQENEIKVLNVDISLHYEKSKNLYEKLISSGIDKKQAILVLPRGLYKEVYCTITAYDFIKIYKILNQDSYPISKELAEYLIVIKRIFKEIFPKIYKCITSVNY
jgi:thymidylate synthase ThyX